MKYSFRFFQISCLILLTNLLKAQNFGQMSDFRDNFVGVYQRLNGTCVGSGPLNYTVTIHPTALDSLYIIDGMMQHSPPDPYLWKVKINQDSTWLDNGIHWGNFKKNDTLTVFYAPVVCGFFTVIYSKKISTNITNIKDDVFLNQVHIYPNPFSCQTTLYVDRPLEGASLTITNIYGQILKEITNIHGQSLILQRENFISGLYFYKLTQGNQIIFLDKLVIND
jgi:hypothetical protein